MRHFWVIFKHCGDEFNVPKKFFENLLIFKLFDLLVTNIFPYFGSWLTPNMTAEVSVLLIAAVPVCQTLWLASILSSFLEHFLLVLLFLQLLRSIVWIRDWITNYNFATRTSVFLATYQQKVMSGAKYINRRHISAVDKYQ